MSTAVLAPGATAGGRGEAMPRRAIEAHLAASFPSLSRSQIGRIARNHRTIRAAENEARARLGSHRLTYADPTGNTAVRNVLGGVA